VPQKRIRREPGRSTPAGEQPTHDRQPADEVLRLQRLVGNTRVTSLIARSQLQRDNAPKAGPVPADARDESKSGSGITMDMSGVGKFELLSLSIDTTRPSRTEPERERPKEDKEQEKDKKKHEGPKELSASRYGDKLSSVLMRRMVDGAPIDKVTIVMRKGGKVAYTLTLTGVHVSSYQTSGGGGDRPIDVFSLSADKSEIEFAESGQ
jgi:Type VI secretion system effector, Hcp